VVTQQLPAVAVVYGLGAASPGEIVTECDGLCAPIFVVAGSDSPVRASRELLEQLAPLVDWAEGGLDAVARALSGRGVEAVVTFSDRFVAAGAELGELAGLPGHTRRTVAALTDKLEQRRRLRAAGLATPRFRVVRTPEDVEDALEDLGEIVLKPRSGTGSVDTIAVVDGPSVQLARSRILGDGKREFVAEELLQGAAHPRGDWLGDYLSVETIAFQGGYRHLCVADKLPLAWPFRETGMVLPSTAPELGDEAVALAEAALTACGVREGATQTELKLTPEGLRVIEINGRLGGSVHRLVAAVSSVSPIRQTIAAALGREPVTDARFSALSFQYLVPAPAFATSLLAPPDARRLLALPGVYAVDGRAERGASLDWRLGTLGRICTVWATCSEAADARRLVEAVDGVVQQTARFAGDASGLDRQPLTGAGETR
jgi:biotin carboxylase